MAHGWSALLLCLIVLCAWSARGAASSATLVTGACGVAAGWLFATRPVTGLVAVALAAALLHRRAPRRNLALLVGFLPGIALLLAHQRAATGSWFGSTQLRYYALADGPIGCFRYGFGAGIGCRYEHGDFVQARLSGGYGLLEAIGTTLRRLQHHALDIANFEPLALFLVVALVAAARHPAARWLALAVVMTVLAYVPFYFDGTYPGGGARFYADVLPLEHALVAWTLIRLRAAFVAIPLSLAGFATHGVFSHRALAEREGGRPMFEPAQLLASGITRGLVWVDTDHGFNLGHAPGQLDAARGPVIARWRGDAHDRALWEALGQPPAYRYVFDAFAPHAEPSIHPQAVDSGARWRFEAEAGWPLLAIEGGWARPEHTVPCASAGRALRVSPTGASASTLLEVWCPRAGTYDVSIGLIGGTRDGLAVRLRDTTWEARPKDQRGCWGLHAWAIPLSAGPQRFRVEASGGDSLIDYVELAPAVPSPQ
jgi:hypothetical protein